MSVWLVRAGQTGDREDFALDNDVAVVGWDDMPNLASAETREELDQLYLQTYPDAGKNRRSNHVGQLWAFSHRIKPDDLVVLPLKRSSAIAIGKVTGPYQYVHSPGTPEHRRPVQWLRTDIPRTSFDQDLLYSFGAFMTVCAITRNDAETRIRALLAGEPPMASDATGSADEESIPDIEQIARDQISTHVLQKFKGHHLTDLVAAVLQAEGYVVQVSPPGADGGVDILAGTGPLGFAQPRLCVQVKSQQSPADVTVFRSLQGSMQTFGAEQGLLVCWGGFNKAVQSESRLSYFRIRLWDAGALLEAVLRMYSKLPKELQTELPLKRVWALVLEE
ncbi:MAG: restriction endonuclease [Myxococcales bacterium]|nr:restriction endonuclease [Myxococcales bacterium]MCB9583634.1 restriction endonuclease [Polyangiaceae bacterium]